MIVVDLETLAVRGFTTDAAELPADERDQLLVERRSMLEARIGRPLLGSGHSRSLPRLLRVIRVGLEVFPRPRSAAFWIGSSTHPLPPLRLVPLMRVLRCRVSG